MLKLLSTRCAWQIARPPYLHRYHSYQAALRVPVNESPLPEFDYRALLVDAAGTLLVPSEPAAEVYLRYGYKYGVSLSSTEVLNRFRRAYNTPWTVSNLRYVGDGKPFWRNIVSQSTGCTNAALFEEIYEYYAQPTAWHVTPGAETALQQLKNAGIKLAVVSNFDTRLRPLLKSLGILHLFDAVIISAEIGVEKPNPIIFEAACQQLDVRPEATVHVGDDRRNDIFGARDANCFAWLWGIDVQTFDEVKRRMLHEEQDPSEADTILSPIF